MGDEASRRVAAEDKLAKTKAELSLVGYRVQGIGYRVQGIGYRVQDTGCELAKTKAELSLAGYRVPWSAVGYRVQGRLLGLGACE